MTVQEVMDELESMGSATTKKTLMRHGAKEPFFGVKVGDMKKIQKRIKKDYQLALDLYATGNSDAMYLAGLIADDAKMTKEDLQTWVEQAYWYMIAQFTVPWVAAGSDHGWELAMQWIESDSPMIATAGWATISAVIAVKEDTDLDLKQLKKLLKHVEKSIHKKPDRVKYAMNGFVIALAGYVVPLSDSALDAAIQIGEVEVDMGDTSCQVPFAPDYIKKIQDRGTIGKKRKTMKC